MSNYALHCYRASEVLGSGFRGNCIHRVSGMLLEYSVDDGRRCRMPEFDGCCGCDPVWFLQPKDGTK